MRLQLSRLQPSSADDERIVRFIDDNKDLGFSRDRLGRLELLFAGAELTPRMASVRARLSHDDWLTAEGRWLPANRLVLDPGEQFDAAGALICIELLRLGFQRDPQTAFAAAEPVIDMVLKRVESEAAVLTGLAGELLTLDWLTAGRTTADATAAVATWRGWEPSSRDFQLGPIGVEVKTTTTGASSHKIEGWYQVERGVGVDGALETHLFLLSIGIVWLEPSLRVDHSIRRISERIADRVDVINRDLFLRAVSGYAGANLEVDAHGIVVGKAVERPFMPSFERLYDMSDDRVRVLRSSDLADFHHVKSDTVSFQIELPDRVRGDLNPITGASAISRRLRA